MEFGCLAADSDCEYLCFFLATIRDLGFYHYSVFGFTLLSFGLQMVGLSRSQHPKPGAFIGEENSFRYSEAFACQGTLDQELHKLNNIAIKHNVQAYRLSTRNGDIPVLINCYVLLLSTKVLKVCLNLQNGCMNVDYAKYLPNCKNVS